MVAAPTFPAGVEPVSELPLEPDLPIVDPHHHLWLDDASHPTAKRYTIDDLEADLRSGHNVLGTVYMECSSAYLEEGPAALRPVGETAWVSSFAGARIAGMVGYGDLRLGSGLGPVLDAHREAGGSLFKGIRCGAAWDPSPEVMTSGHDPEPGLLGFEETGAALEEIAVRGLVFDTWVYHPQLEEVGRLAAAHLQTPIVLGHLGGPLAVGPYAGRRDEVRQAWKLGLERVAQQPNVHLKLGGIGLPPLLAEAVRSGPRTSERLAEHWREDFLFCIEAFGAERCMFESNFPVDSRLCDYVTLWNTFKRISQDLPPADREAVLRTTAARVYGLKL